MRPPGVSDRKKYNCPYCHTASDFYFPFHTRTYYNCPSCDLIFVKRKRGIKTSIAYYQNHYFDEYTKDQTSRYRTSIYRYILDVIEDSIGSGKILDLGCGCGLFLNEAKSRGWQVAGVDPSLKSVAYAKSIVGEYVTCGTLDDIPTDHWFDVITLINVLDHMVDACRQLQKVYNHLGSNGIIYLRFPNGNFHSFVMRLSLALSAKQFMNPFLVFHEYAITPRAIKRCLMDLGFQNIQVSNSPLAGDDLLPGKRLIAKSIIETIRALIWGFFKSLEKLSGGRWLWGPSLQVIARKGIGGSST
ncbi:MAG: class I SAM-dependent methyltransferase [Pseudomonadota bacterium]